MSEQAESLQSECEKPFIIRQLKAMNLVIVKDKEVAMKAGINLL